MPGEVSKCRLQVVVVETKEPELYKAAINLKEQYADSELLKEALRCLAKREGLFSTKEAAL